MLDQKQIDKAFGKIIFDNERSKRLTINEVVVKDHYGLYDFVNNPPDNFIDIGANYGVTSMFARILYPNAKIYAFEPMGNTFMGLGANVKRYNVIIHQIALGPNGYVVSIFDKFATCSYTEFVTDFSKHKREDLIISMPLVDIFKMLNISGSYVLKVDVEGGERILVGDTDSEDIIGKSKRFMMEFHFDNKPEWLKKLDYIQWFDNLQNKFPARSSRIPELKGHTGIYITDEQC